MNEKGGQLRLFFALWPDDEVRQQMADTFQQASQSAMPGRLMNPENLHITLHFIGNVSQQTMDCMHQAAQTVKVPSFKLMLNHYGYFLKPRVLWMGCEQWPDQAAVMQQQLGEALKICGYTAESRRFVPHVTLIRKLVNPGELKTFKPIPWVCNEFALVQSVPIVGGVRYQVIQRYPMPS